MRKPTYDELVEALDQLHRDYADGKWIEFPDQLNSADKAYQVLKRARMHRAREGIDAPRCGQCGACEP